MHFKYNNNSPTLLLQIKAATNTICLLIPSHEEGLGLQYWRNTFSPWEPWWESLVWGEWGRNRDKGQSWKLLFPGQNQTSGAKETETATFITTFLLCFKSVFLSLLSLSPLFLPPPQTLSITSEIMKSMAGESNRL